MTMKNQRLTVGHFAVLKFTTLKVTAVAFGLIFLGCQNAPFAQVDEAPAVTGEAPPSLEVMAETNAQELADLALRLAGLEGREEPGWSEHAQAMDELWSQLDGRHLGPMRVWAQAELQSRNPQAPLFYPFGGPDLPSAHQFFPVASAYYLVGLEPPGAIPSLEGLEGEALVTELSRLRDGLGHLVEAGYFVTTQMERDFAAAQRLDGFLPVLYLTLARLGYLPRAVRYVSLDEQGDVVAMNEAAAEMAGGVEIQFVSATDFAADPAARSRRVFYFSQDLSDEGLTSSAGFARLVSAEPFNTYMKSAEYLPHMEGFDVLDRLILEGSGTLLQDDSGVPFARIDPSQFDRRLFGVYTATLPNYRPWFQEDLRAAYELDTGGPLEFAIGYNSKISGSCLIWAERMSRPMSEGDSSSVGS